MSNIQIFVSHRIDIDSELIDNPIYIPVRCGAMFDDRSQMHIQGDNIGDHISERRMSFCEFTVEYWAWKNIDADYYGLCHYRRYLSFSERRFKTDAYNMIHIPVLTPGSKQKYGLLDASAMEQIILNYDIITSESANVQNIPTPNGYQKNVRGLWEAHDGLFFKKSAIDLMFELIDHMAPLYSQSAREYFSDDKHRGYNCFVLRKDLFFRLCDFQFPIMFEVERRLDTTCYSQMMSRTPAFIGEMLYGIFLYHVTTYEQWRVKELQLVFFSDTERIKGRADLIKRYLWFGIDRALRAIADPILPKGSRRREVLKDIFYRLTPARRRGMADIQ